MAQYNFVEMTNGTKYNVLVEYNQLCQLIDSALKQGGLLTLPMGHQSPGSPQVINPQHIVSIDDLSKY